MSDFDETMGPYRFKKKHRLLREWYKSWWVNWPQDYIDRFNLRITAPLHYPLFLITSSILWLLYKQEQSICFVMDKVDDIENENVQAGIILLFIIPLLVYAGPSILRDYILKKLGRELKNEDDGRIQMQDGTATQGYVDPESGIITIDTTNIEWRDPYHPNYNGGIDYPRGNYGLYKWGERGTLFSSKVKRHRLEDY